MVNITFYEDRCKGCKLCLDVCPKKIVIINEEKINSKGYHPAGVKDANECIGCGFCRTICPDCAIEIIKE